MKELKLVAKGGMLSLLGDATNYSLSYVFLFFASNFLGASLLGAYYWALSITSLLGEFADCGTGQGLIYYGPRSESGKGKDRSLPLFRFILGFTITNAFILGAAVFILAGPIASFFHKPELAWLLRIFAVGMPLSAFWPVLYKYCVARFMIAEGILYGDILRPVIRVIALLVFIALGMKALALVGTELFVGAVLVLIGFIIIGKIWAKGFVSGKLDPGEKKALLLYSLPFIPLNLARGERAVIIIAGFFLAVAQVGIFGVVIKLAAISQVILTGLNFIFRPMVAKLYSEKEFATLSSIYKAITRWIFILTLPLSYLFIFYPAATLNLFGEKFAGGAAALAIVAIGFLFEYGTSATQVIINMAGKSWWSLINQLVCLSAIALLGIGLIPNYGIVGAAIAVAAGLFITNLLRLIQSFKLVGFTPYSPYLIKPLLAALISGILIQFIFPVGQIIPAARLILMFTAFCAVYSVLILLFRIDADDWSLLTAAKNRVTIGSIGKNK